jgi:hypothetical protein
MTAGFIRCGALAKLPNLQAAHHIHDKEMAQILTDPRNGPLFRKLIDLKANSSQAGAIAARMIMQARGASGGGPDSREPSEQVDQLR